LTTPQTLGWFDFFEAGRAASPEPAWPVARVCAAHRDAFELLAPGEPAALWATLPGAWRLSHAPEALPTVGDWVQWTRPEGAEDARITHVLPRRSCFVRRANGARASPQLLAANVDTVLLVSGVDHDLNPNRLMRYLAQLHDSGARPVLVLNKADSPEAAAQGLDTLGPLAERWPVHALSALNAQGLTQLEPYLGPGQTVALVGSSGVGKSTLANRLLGVDRQETGAVRAHDQRGRHTTTRRELLHLPGGALLLDSPGLRSLGLWDAEAGVDAVFDAVVERARDCRFRDCRHRGEPGCAVEAAIEDGSLPAHERDAWEAMRREAAFEARKADPALMANERRLWKQRSKALRRMSE
jgi:ribosome biogenesis GTPase